ncbi:hypothetical protein D3C81_1392950 [compost metagenome]
MQAVTFVEAVLHFRFGQGVGGNHFQVFGNVGNRFKFKAVDFHFAGLAGDGYATHVVGDRDVLLGQVIHSCRQQRVGARWLVFDAQLPLLALGRLERLGRRGAGIAGRLEGLGIRKVRHEARIEHVAESRVAAELLVPLGIGGITLV